MKRLLFISHRVPYPPDKGERVRAFHEIEALAQHFRVTVAALTHQPSDVEAAAELKHWCEKVITAPAGGRVRLLRGGMALLCGRSVTEGFFHSRRLAYALGEEAAREPFDLVLAYSSSTIPYALGVPAGARIADLVDVDSAKWATYAQVARWPRRWLYRREARGVQSLEQRAIDECDAVVLVSPDEVKALGIMSHKVAAIGNGVDTEYFKPTDDEEASPPSLVFTGTMDYKPNIDGVCWFVREVWPALRRDVPDLTFSIVGRNPTRAVRKLVEIPGVRVTGSVPDVRPYLAKATLAVVPLLIARGVQNKILEAMAMGRAVVASPQGLEGLEVAVGTETLQARTPDEWQRCILELLQDNARRQQVEHAARTCVEQKYAWAARLQPLLDLCERLGAGCEAGAPSATRPDEPAASASPNVESEVPAR